MLAPEGSRREMQRFDVSCHTGVSMHDGFRWLDCHPAHMRAQKHNLDYRGSKPDQEPKRSDAWGKIGVRCKRDVAA